MRRVVFVNNTYYKIRTIIFMWSVCAGNENVYVMWGFGRVGLVDLADGLMALKISCAKAKSSKGRMNAKVS